MAATPLPPHLAQTEATGFHAEHCVSQYELGPMRNFVYLVVDHALRRAAIVDPQRDLRPVQDLEARGYRLDSILLTHSHHDHVAGLAPIRERFPEIPIFLHRADFHRIEHTPAGGSHVHFVEDDSEVRVGSLTLRAHHTPGHSAGALTYLLNDPKLDRPYLFTGDTVFIRDCGRTDFPDSSNDQMFASLQRFRRFPADAIVLPGHHYARETASRLEREWNESPPFGCRSAEELASLP